MPASFETESIRIAGAVGKTTTGRMIDAVLAGSAEARDRGIVVVLTDGRDADGIAWDDLVAELDSTGIAVISADAAGVRLADSCQASRITFGLSPAADVRADDIETTLDGTSFTLHHNGYRSPVTLPILGEHHVMNALAAVAVAVAVGIPTDSAIASLERIDELGPSTMRQTRRPDGVVIINDAVSAAPTAMTAALKTLALVTPRTARSVAVLGELDETGEDSREAHDAIGRLIVRLNIKKLFVVGNDARHIHNAAGLEGSWDGESELVGTSQEAYDLLREQLRAGDVVLVKSSRRAGLDALAERLGGSDS